MPKLTPRMIISLLIALALLLLPLITDDDNILTLLLLTFLMAGLASSWNILGGYTGQVNLGHAAFFGIGSLITRQMWLGGWPFALSMASGCVVAGLAAAVIGLPAFRLKGTYFAIGTLAMAEALRITIGNILPTVTNLPTEVIRNYELAPRYYLMLTAVLLIVAITIYLNNSKLGLGMMAVREDEDAARAVGVNVLRVKMIAFVMSAFLAGMIGGAYAFYFVSYYPNFTFGPLFSFDAITVLYVGGVGTVVGPLIGSVFFVILRDMLVKNLQGVHQLVFGLLFIVVVLVLPGGLVEAWDRIKQYVRINQSPTKNQHRETKAQTYPGENLH
ncbi:MAG: branched-chain amino acid ABC transporter permease [Chloroflexota bacterium]|nr:branched-chain amino acid ABC transporter permease [Anaerolineales bacterium]MCB8965758.1 branched-chain amino acid ABC transporter permease [Ardenticatenaceae bacterium]